MHWWKERFENRQVRQREIVERDGRLTLDFEDPEGQRFSLIDDGASGNRTLGKRARFQPSIRYAAWGRLRSAFPISNARAGFFKNSSTCVLRGIRREWQIHRARLRNGPGWAICRIARRGRAGTSTGPAGRRRRASCRLSHNSQRLQWMGRSPRRGPCSVERAGGSVLFFAASIFANPMAFYSRLPRMGLASRLTNRLRLWENIFHFLRFSASQARDRIRTQADQLEKMEKAFI